MASSSSISCEYITIEGVLEDVLLKKSGQISKLFVRTQEGLCKVKASKHLRLAKGCAPKTQDWVKLKVIKKTKSDRIKFKGLELQVLKSNPKRSPKCTKPIELAICQSSSCRKRGSEKLRSQVEKALSPSRSGHCRVTNSKCLGKCKAGPVAKVKPSGQVYAKLNSKTALQLLKP